MVDERTWLRINENEWTFGVPVRGVIRDVLAEVYFDEERKPGWVWRLNKRIGKDRAPVHRGACSYFHDAIEAAETALGITSAAAPVRE